MPAIDLSLEAGVALVGDVVFEVLEGKPGIRAGKGENEHQEGSTAAPGAGYEDLVRLIGRDGRCHLDRRVRDDSK